MKNLLLKIAALEAVFLLALAPLVAAAQSYPAPTFNSLILQNPLTPANGGTGATSSTGTGSAVLSNSPVLTAPNLGTPSAVTLTNGTGLPLSGLTTQAANTVLANVTGSTTSPTAFAMPSCSGSNNALRWTSGTGFTCASSIGLTSSGLSQFASTTSAQLASIISDETGSGSLVFGTSPTLTTPNLGTPSAVTLTNGTGLPVAGIAGTGTGVATMLGTATNASGGAVLANGSITSGNCLKWSATGVQDSGLGCFNPNVFNVLNYGAVSDANGSHGVGTDNKTAFQNAWNAAGASSITTIFIPCGTYRLTGAVTVTDQNPRVIQGAGACTRIYSDQTTAGVTFSFSPSSGTCSTGGSQPCAIIKDLTFLTPNTLGAGQSALYFNNYNSPYVDNVQFVGQQVSATYINSFAPRFHNSRVYGGVTGIYSTDLSFNSGEIWSNSIYNMTGNGIQITPSSGCASNVSIKNNDFEQAATSLAAGGICGGSFVDNYIENTHTQTPFNFTGANSSILFRGNLINGATDSGTGTLTIANLVNAQWLNNNFVNITVSYGSGAAQNRLRASENSLSTATLPVPTVSCTGLGTGGSCTLSGDDQYGFVNMTTGTASVGSGGNITITFTNALGPNNASCSWTPIHNTGTWTAPATVIGSSAAKTSTIGQYWNGASTVLTASKSYLMGYQCGGW